MVNHEHNFFDHYREKNDLLVSSNKVDVPKASSKFDSLFTQDLSNFCSSDWTDRSTPGRPGYPRVLGQD